MPKSGAAASEADDAGENEEQAARVLRLVRTHHTQVPKTPECSCAVVTAALSAEKPAEPEAEAEAAAEASPRANVNNLLNNLKDVLKEKSNVSGALMAKLDWMERECQSVITDLQRHAAPPLITSLHSYDDEPCGADYRSC